MQMDQSTSATTSRLLRLAPSAQAPTPDQVGMQGHKALSAVLELSRLTCLRLYCAPSFTETSYLGALKGASLSAQEEAVFAGQPCQQQGGLGLRGGPPVKWQANQPHTVSADPQYSSRRSCCHCTTLVHAMQAGHASMPPQPSPQPYKQQHPLLDCPCYTWGGSCSPCMCRPLRFMRPGTVSTLPVSCTSSLCPYNIRHWRVGVFAWRDAQARQEDESPGYVLSTRNMLRLAQKQPRTAQAFCGPQGIFPRCLAS